MAKDHNRDVDVPVGLDFLELVWKQEDACELVTDVRIPDLGQRGHKCLEGIGTVLSFMDRMASCWWRCQRGDHQVEYLCGRVASNARAALRLMKFGFYDESLMICRTMGEAANLLNLFALDKPILEEWKSGKRLDPVVVRKRVEKLQNLVLIDQERYGLLSERTAHIRPGTGPQSYNIPHIPILGAHLQDEGALLCLNEVALPLSIAATYGALLLDLEADVKKDVISSAIALVEQLGRATITEIDAFYSQFAKGNEP